MDIQVSANDNNRNFKLKKCSCCGADLIFDIDTNSLFCEHCESRYPVKNIPFTTKTAFDPANIRPERIDNQMVSVRCNSCGASMVLDSSSISSVCPFCSSSKIINTTSTMHYPEAIIPFSVKKEQTPLFFARWVKKRRFTKSGFKKLAILDNAKPVYTPVWMFDAHTYSSYSGTIYYNVEKEVRRPDGRTETKTVTEYRNVSGKRHDDFRNISIPAGDKVDNKSYSKIEPFNISNIKVFSPEFLAGYYASNYTIDLSSSWSKARTDIDLITKNRIVNEYGADGYKQLKVNPTYSATTYCYTLFPVWICTYMFKEEVYNVFINGTTGKTTGKAPISKLKVFFFILFLIALILSVFFILSETH